MSNTASPEQFPAKAGARPEPSATVDALALAAIALVAATGEWFAERAAEPFDAETAAWDKWHDGDWRRASDNRAAALRAFRAAYGHPVPDNWDVYLPLARAIVAADECVRTEAAAHSARLAARSARLAARSAS